MKYKSDLFNIITPVVVDNGKFFINDLFNKKFHSDAPDFSNHLVGFYKNSDAKYSPVSYASFMPYKNVILVGGVMTDGEVIRNMTETERQIITNSGGIYFNMLKYAFEYFSSKCDAYFGYTNDQRALEVNLSAGFEKTPYQYLIANYHKPLSNWKKNRMTKMVRDIGPF
jgi:hypothetical protein